MIKSLRIKWTENVPASVRIETYTDFWWDNLRKIDHLEDIGAYGK
jgi:hypothetical protein